MKQKMTSLIVGLLFTSLSFGQKAELKTNLLYDATTTPNLAVEIPLRLHSTLDFSVGYNPWDLGSNKKLKHILVQPEYRYWLKEHFNGSFFGVHALYSHYNIGGISAALPEITGLRLDKQYRYQGDAYGAGISYGYQRHLSQRWKIEATLGIGYIYLDYDKYECKDCGKRLDTSTQNYFGLTKAGISLIYAFGKTKEKPPVEYTPVAPVAPVKQPEPAPAPAPEPAPAPAPIVPKLTTGDKLAQILPFISKATPIEFAQITESKDAIALFKDDREQDMISVTFAQGKSNLDPNFENNRSELEKIKKYIQEIKDSDDSQITGIVIVGFASPEGRASYNKALAGQRAESMKKHLETYVVRPVPVKLFNEEINYQGLRKLVAASDMPSRDKVLDIIDNVPIWDAKKKVGRLGALQRLDGGVPYKYMYKEFFPQLRVATYVKVLYDNK